MKKIFALLLAFLLLPLPVWAGGEETPPPPPEPEYEPLPDEYKTLAERSTGDWYADSAGLTITLTLSEDGAYALTVPGSEAMTGLWEEKDGMLIMDGDGESTLLPVGGVLRMDPPGLLFMREQPEVYVPAEPIADAKEGIFDGWWVSHFTAVGDGTILSDAIGEDTELYIEGTKLAVNGSLFGLAQYDGAIESGKLTFTADKGAVTLELLQDGFLRLTLSGDTPATLYLMAKPLPGETPEAETP